MSSPRQNQTRTRLSSSHNPIHYDIGDEAAAEERLDILLSRTVICRDYKRKAAGLVICQFVPPLGRNSCIQVSVGKMMRPVGYNRGGGGGEGGGGGGGGGKVLVGHVDCPHEALG